jgi:hypothetical protein
MKKRLVFICWLSIAMVQAMAQTTKPAVLVVGNGNAAASAAIQAAVSGVKTTILLQAGGFDISPIAGDLTTGIQADFLKRIYAAKGLKDSSLTIPFDKQTANDVLVKWTDTLKNLTVIKNVMWTKADRSGSSWTFRLNDGQTIKPRVLIHAGDAKLQAALAIKTLPGNYEVPLDYEKTLYRTSLAANNATVVPMYNFFILDQENLLWLKSDDNMLIGQAAGAIAAYAGFFGTKTSVANLKVIQGELINYKLNLMPFSDIKQTDANWKAIQFVGVTGVLKAVIQDKKAEFLPDKLVGAEEVKQPIKDFYYKAQIWFDDHKGEALSMKALIDLVCYVGQKSPQSTPKEIEKKWKTAYKFNTDFDLNRLVNRREFAVILQDYMPPFNVNVDKNGKVVR